MTTVYPVATQATSYEVPEIDMECYRAYCPILRQQSLPEMVDYRGVVSRTP